MSCSLIFCVVNMGGAAEVLKSAQKYGVTNGIVSIGQGTVNSRLLKFFSINEIRKEIVTMAVEKERASEVIRGLSEDMEFEKPHHGIAYSYSVSEYINGENVSAAAEAEAKVRERRTVMYNIIHVIVDKGRAEDVVEAANKAGAKGGTIVNARGAGVSEVQKFFSIEIDPEKEKVFIIAKTEQKNAIVESIRTSLKLDEPGNGVLFVLDVDEVYGLH